MKTSASASGPSKCSHKWRLHGALRAVRRLHLAAALRADLAPLIHTLMHGGRTATYGGAECPQETAEELVEEERELAAESLTARFDSLPAGHPSLPSSRVLL